MGGKYALLQQDGTGEEEEGNQKQWTKTTALCTIFNLYV